MKLVLAEKPSVAMSLSKVIGADQRGDGYMEGNGYLVSWCVGHLVELSQPEAYDESMQSGSMMIFRFCRNIGSIRCPPARKAVRNPEKLMQRKDVESLICATDAGREGELIFRLVYHQCGCKSRWNGFGFHQWRTVLSGKAFRSSDREQNMMPYMRRLYAGSEPTGLSESTPPGFFHVCMGRP